MYQRDTIFWWKTVSAPRSVDSRSYRVQLGRSGDQICLFGFSRGAFTARALAGMVQKVGILPPRNIEQLQFAFAVYEREDDVGLEQSLQSKRSFSVEVRIKFIGVWYVTRSIGQLPISLPFRDTVESVGLFEKRLPFCVSNNAIESSYTSRPFGHDDDIRSLLRS